MSVAAYRPSGLFDWVLKKLPVRKYSLIGCLSTEERSLTAWKTLVSTGCLANIKLLEIEDRPSPRFSALSAKMREQWRQEFLGLGASNDAIEKHRLEEREEDIRLSTIEFLKVCGPNVVIDLSSLPKKFFFPIVKMILAADVENVIATYTVPETYTPGSLAEDLDTWKPLPMFRPPIDEPDDKLVVVGLGFEPHSLPELLGQGFRSAKLVLLFPFPPGPPGFQRNWEFVRKIRDSVGNLKFDLVPVSAYAVGEVFDYLRKESDSGSKYTVLAPYGPKSMSLAMCLFAVHVGDSASVFYTQPRVYNPEYSTGVKQLNGVPFTQAYCLRLSGRNLYPTEQQTDKHHGM